MSEEFKTYMFSYRHDGANWAFSIPAKSELDAKQRLTKIAFAQYDGVLAARIPVPNSIAKIAAKVIRFFGNKY